jgi:CheY-like chemotaxis protein
MDLHMPVLDGLRTTTEIKKEHRYDDIAIIAMTAEIQDNVQKEILNSGMDDFLTKPVNPALLLHTLQLYLPQPSPEPDVHPSTTFPLALDQINCTKGLEHCAHNHTLYAQILLSFVTHHKDTMEQLSRALHQSDYERARHLLHTLKGATGNIGALSVENRIEQLLQLLHTKEPDPARINNKRIEINTQFTRVLFSIQSATPRLKGVIEHAQSTTRSTGEDLLKLMQQLTRQLAQSDTAAIETYAQLQHHRGAPAWIEELQTLIETYRFDEALNRLQQLQPDV